MSTTRHEHWRVSVETSGEHIVSIEPEMLAGREISEADEGAIRTAAHHLLSFIGDTPSASSPEPVAWLRQGAKEPVQGVPFGAMWITDEHDPKGFPVYAIPSPSPQMVGSALQASDLEFENGKLVKVRGARPEYSDGYKLIEYVRELAGLVYSAAHHRQAFCIDRGASIAALQEWSDQKYGSPFSISACNDLLSVLAQFGILSQEPVVWVVPGSDNARDDGSIDAMAWKQGEFTRPLYAAGRAALSSATPEKQP